MRNTGKIILDAPAIDTFEKKFGAWIVVTGDFGAPETDFHSDFVDCFGRYVNSDSFDMHPSYIYELCKHYDDKYFKPTGGIEFFRDLAVLKGKDKDEMLKYLQSWQQMLNNLPDGEVGVYNMNMMNNLKDDVILEVGSENVEYHAIIEYNSITKLFTIRDGARAKNFAASTMPDRYLNIYLELQSRGVISLDGIFLKPYAARSLTEANTLIRNCSIGVHDVYIKDTKVKLSDCLDTRNWKQEIMYEKYIKNVSVDNATDTGQEVENIEDNVEIMDINSEVESMANLSKLLKDNRHKLVVDVVYDLHGGCNILAMYDPEKDIWEIISGKICSENPNLKSPKAVEAEKLIKDALGSGQIKPDYTIDESKPRLKFTGITNLVPFCIRSERNWAGAYIHGTEVELKKLSGKEVNIILYNRYIKKNQKTWEDIK